MEAFLIGASVVLGLEAVARVHKSHLLATLLLIRF